MQKISNKVQKIWQNRFLFFFYLYQSNGLKYIKINNVQNYCSM